jgi:hypothetical protein
MKSVVQQVGFKFNIYNILARKMYRIKFCTMVQCDIRVGRCKLLIGSNGEGSVLDYRVILLLVLAKGGETCRKGRCLEWNSNPRPAE